MRIQTAKQRMWFTLAAGGNLRIASTLYGTKLVKTCFSLLPTQNKQLKPGELKHSENRNEGCYLFDIFLTLDQLNDVEHIYETFSKSKKRRPHQRKRTSQQLDGGSSHSFIELCHQSKVIKPRKPKPQGVQWSEAFASIKTHSHLTKVVGSLEAAKVIPNAVPLARSTIKND